MIEGIIVAIVSLMFWVFGAFCLRGINRFLLNGYTKKEAEKAKEQFDVILMNRYIGKTIIIPIAIILTFISVWLLFDFHFMSSTVVGVAFGIATLAVIILCFYSVTQILGNRFKKQGENSDVQNIS